MPPLIVIVILGGWWITLAVIALTLLAGIGHFWLGHVNFKLLVSLLAGSIPGIIIGARLTRHLNMTFLRIALAGMLFFSGARLLM